ncbi:hypothetical protein NDR87_30565 [Nocardia sp. CDC159]|uniref:Uncharacterized protein n=1 Tax=Nocardia pulmonis TaxID=2951408 RepID=A0A9X2EBF8_9NOCA|nr:MULTISPECIES: hypothetical protein [Nocardia]MCM6777839.1 hypothetical protein [Nocardia pulmonis]MCM6790723.1 hypothetical protein [Nocardia sp. CDC159]
MRRTIARLAVAAAAIGVSALAAPIAQADPAPLNGLFTLAPGVCANGSVTGSFFRMILPTGDAGGPYLQNSDSRCSDQTVTPLSAGTDGGLVSGGYQPQPEAAFDATGNARSGRVTTPVRFYGVDFATATNPTDPQTGQGTGLPQIFADGGELSGDLSSLGVTWNNQVFNQGAPKPGGGLPGKTSPVRGSIDGAGNFVLEWTSQIVGGPFNNFTGLWHLAGQYRGGGRAPAAAPVAPSGGAPAQPAAPITNPGAPQANPAPGAPAQNGPTPGAPAPNPAVPAAPGAPAPGAPAQAGVSAAVHPAPTLATRTIDLPRKQQAPAWVVPALLLLALVAAAVFFKADAIAGRRQP